MKFAFYGPSMIEKVKVQWDEPVTVTRQIRAAMHPEDPTTMRPGSLTRAFMANHLVHRKNALVFGVPADGGIWIEV
ncbi:MAG: hypothetical protein IPK60_11145 [Sandaracinaceae bacterium]|jgi:hypothetical protein|nr:hypothetical protein [Sandaracinaceae bacterium]